MRPLISVASKELTGSLNSLESTLTKNTGVGGVMVNQLPSRFDVQSTSRQLPGVYQQFPFWLAQRMLEGFTQLAPSSEGSGRCEGNSASARTGASIDTRGEAAYLSAPMESLAKRR